MVSCSEEGGKVSHSELGETMSRSEEGEVSHSDKGEVSHSEEGRMVPHVGRKTNSEVGGRMSRTLPESACGRGLVLVPRDCHHERKQILRTSFPAEQEVACHQSAHHAPCQPQHCRMALGAHGALQCHYMTLGWEPPHCNQSGDSPPHHPHQRTEQTVPLG